MFSRVEMLDIRNRMKNSSYVDDDFFHTFIKDGYVGLFFPRIEDGKEENKEDVESDLSNELDELIEHKWDRVEFVFDWNNIRIFEKNEFEHFRMRSTYFTMTDQQWREVEKNRDQE